MLHLLGHCARDLWWALIAATLYEALHNIIETTLW
jgi:hypothetical protein